MSTIRDPQLAVLWMSGRTYNQNEQVATHQHGFNQLQVILDGEEALTIAGHEYAVFAHQLSLIRPNTPHAFHFAHDAVVFDIKFTASPDFQALLDQAPVAPICDVTELEPFRQLLTQATISETSDSPYAKILLDVRFKDLLLDHLFGHHLKVQDDLIQPMTAIEADTSFAPLQYLKAHYAEPITLEDLAEQFHYSKNYVIEMSKKQTGVTPNVLLQAIRLRHAKNFLEYTDLEVNDIANRVGLDANYLTKLFTKRFGLSPLAYRKSSRDEHRQNVVLAQTFHRDRQPKIE